MTFRQAEAAFSEFSSWVEEFDQKEAANVMSEDLHAEVERNGALEMKFPFAIVRPFFL